MQCSQGHPCQHGLSFPNLLHARTFNGNPLVVKNTFIDFEANIPKEASPRRAFSMPKLGSGCKPRVPAENAMHHSIFLEPEERNVNGTALMMMNARNIGALATTDLGGADATLKDDDGQSHASTRTSEGRLSDGRSSDWSLGHISSDEVEVEKTTVMLRHLPEGLRRQDLVDLLNREGFYGRFDYIYLPLHFGTLATFGYAFINLETPQDAKLFMEHFDGFTQWPKEWESSRAASVGWSDALQGREAQVVRYRDSRIMHESMPDELKPALYEHGVRVPFPPPTKTLRAPRPRPPEKKHVTRR